MAAQRHLLWAINRIFKAGGALEPKMRYQLNINTAQHSFYCLSKG
jgi:hypothetical protein